MYGFYIEDNHGFIIIVLYHCTIIIVLFCVLESHELSVVRRKASCSLLKLE